MFERENLALFDACRVTHATSSAAAASLDWDYVLRAAERQGVAPLLYQSLKRQSPPPADARIVDWLHGAYWSNHFRNRTLLTERDRLQAAAHAAGIPMLPLKGAALLLDQYPDPALRPLSDLDFLVRVDDHAGMRRVLLDLGYVEVEPPGSYVESSLDAHSREHVFTSHRDNLDVIVEFRAEPLQTSMGRLSDFDATLSAALREYAETVWSRVAAAGARSPSVEDEILQVAAHLAAQHGEFRLIWLHDIARLVSTLR